MSQLQDEIKKAARILQEGGIILYPTDTIWGIGCDAGNAEAVEKVYRLKQRSDSKSMLVLLDSTAKLDYYVADLPDIALDLIELSEKPLTIIYDGARNLATNLLAEDGSVGIRITQEAFSMGLCRYAKRAIVSTSANFSGQAAPGCFADIDPKLIVGVDYVVQYRKDETASNKPSSIIKLGKNAEIKIIRE